MNVRKSLRYGWFVAIVLFLFRSLHTGDQFVISVVLPQILDEFQISYTGAGLIFTATFFMAFALYPVWGYLYDRYSRKKLIALSGVIWGVTTWLNTVPRTFAGFFVTRTLTGIDDTPPSGMNSLVSDYFPPKSRGKALGLINASGAFGALIGTILGVVIGYAMGWRVLFYITGGIGIGVALLVWFTVKDITRGSSEPELAGLEIKDSTYRLNFKEYLSLVKRKSLLFLNLQGFFGVFPWQVLQAWFFTYMMKEKSFNESVALLVMLVLLVTMVAGNVVGGLLGDALFRRDLRGRAIVGAVTVFLSAATIYWTIMWPKEDVIGFAAIGAITAFILPMAGPNVSAAVTDVVEPEARSSGDALLRLFEYGGSSTAPLISGYFADTLGLGMSILYVSFTTWIFCGILFTILAIVIPKDILALRKKMSERAQELRQHPSSR
jgi:predicted MFS family arabinose efflux permease